MTQIDELVKDARTMSIAMDKTFKDSNAANTWRAVANALEAQSARIAILEAQLAAFREALEPFAEAALNLPYPYCDVIEIGTMRDFDLWESPAAIDGDAQWNAAIEASARVAERDKDNPTAGKFIATNIRALKRG